MYIANPDENTKWALLEAQAMSRQLALQLAENKHFFFCSKHILRRGRLLGICSLC